MSSVGNATEQLIVPKAARTESLPEAIAGEYQAIKAGAAYTSLDDRLLVRLSGDDRITFLHGMCTADIKGMIPGQIAPALFVTERAHILCDFFVYALTTELMLEIDRAAWPAIRAHLEKFLVADDVEIAEQESLTVIDCEGPASAAALVAAGQTNEILLATAPQPWRLAPSGGLAHLPRFGADAYTILTNKAGASDLEARLDAAGFTAADAAAREIVRIERGLARIGVDTNDKTLALEARCEPAISFDKGCYIGQETIERATARGGIKRRLYGLRIEGVRTPAAGAAIILVDKQVGVLTSVVNSPCEGVIGLAILHHSAWSVGTVVTLLDPEHLGSAATTARVSELPFTKP
jgi:folate-binding protein YgfZ